MILKCLTLVDLDQVREWRNEQMSMLRTPFLLTEKMQVQFYNEFICNRHANARYWAIYDKGMLIGMCGLENIEWENRLAEISLILKPMSYTEYEKYAEDALIMVLNQAFTRLNLDNIYTEVYGCSSYFEFWIKIAAKYDLETAILPSRKFYDGSYYDSLYVNFESEAFWEDENIIPESTQTVN